MMDQGTLEGLVTAHRILVNENVLDAFGHISLRDDADPQSFWLASACPPNLVEVEDFLAFDLTGEPIEKTERALFAERYIHSAIYAARPDVRSICHHHASSLLPFCLVSRPLVAVSQTGAFIGEATPLWDSADEFGATRMVVDTPAQGESLARGLGAHSLVLMRGHGATVVGSSIGEVVFKAVYACRDAEFQRQASAMGEIMPLSPGEIEKGRVPAKPAVDRCWQYWCAAASAARRTEEG